jgi:ribonuclease HI
MHKIYTDGASRGNPGNAAWAYVIVDEDDNAIVKRDSQYIGHATNNDAEYTAILNALRALWSMNIHHAKVYSDSEIVIRQLTGQYRCKEPRLQKLKAIIKDLEHIISIEYSNVSRDNEFVKICDKMCNITLNKAEVNNEKGNNNQKGLDINSSPTTQ